MGSETQWSMVRYDLKTAIDVLGFPCHVQIPDDNLGAADDKDVICDVNTLSSRVVRLEKKLCTCYVRARILPVQDVEWFIHKKGQDYFKQHERFVNKEILIPVECSTKVRLQDRDSGKQFRSVREVADDFPRFVRVDQDTVCVSPGSYTCQIVRKGSILELDRITKAAQAVRGFRETYLICKHTDTQQELAFKLMSTVKFSKVLDTSAYLIKDLIERIPLPQTVDFLTTNPYDVISVSDEDSRNVLCMLSGPVELVSLKMRGYIVGYVDDTNTIIALPNEDDCLENTLVNIPFSRSRKSTEFVDLQCNIRPASSNSVDFETLMDKLYLAYCFNPSPVLLHTDMTSRCIYDVTEDPLPPPLPARLDRDGDRDNCMLKHTTSDPAIAGRSASRRTSADTRKRIVSTGDIERKTENQQRRQDSLPFKAYLSQFSRRMKTTASHFLFGVQDQCDAQTEVTSSYTELSPGNQNISSSNFPKKVTNTGNDCPISQSSFICYVNEDDTLIDHSKRNTTVLGESKFYCAHRNSDPGRSNKSVYVAYSRVIKVRRPAKSNNNDDINDRNSQRSSLAHSMDAMDVSSGITVNQTANVNNTSAIPEVIYASVNKSFKRNKGSRPLGCCDVCRQIVLDCDPSLHSDTTAPSPR